MPVSFHKKIEPLNITSKEDSETDFYKGYREYTPYKKKTGSNEKGSNNINENIYLRKVPISDDGIPEVVLNVTLLKSNDKKENSNGTEGQNSDANLANDSKLFYYSSIPKRSVKIEALSYNDKGEVVFKEELKLNCIETSYNGMIQYEYNYDPSKSYFLLDVNFDIIHGVYHAIKGFYHKHEYHDHGADSIVNPFCCDSKTSIKRPNTPALLHYLKLFENMIMEDISILKEVKKVLDTKYVKCKNGYFSLFKCYYEVKESLENKEGEDDKLKIELAQLNQSRIDQRARLQHYLSVYSDIKDKYAKILGKNLYYQSLFYSKYNTLFKPFNSTLAFENKEISYKHKLFNGNLDKCEEGSLILTMEKDSLPKEYKSAYKSAINIQNAIYTAKLCRDEIHIFISRENELWVSTIMESMISFIGTINVTTQKTENLSKKADSFGVKSLIFAIVAFIVALALGFFDWFYFSKSASKEDIKLIKGNQQVIERQLNQQNKIIETQYQSIRELKQLILDISKEKKDLPPKAPTTSTLQLPSKESE